MNNQEKEILDFYYKNYSLPLAQGFVAIDFQGGDKTRDGTAYTTYAIGFEKKEGMDIERFRKMLIKACGMTPLPLLTFLPYRLTIRSIEYKITDEVEECSVRLAIEHQ